MIVEGFAVADFPSKEEVTQSAGFISHTPEKYYDLELRDYEAFIKKIIDILKELPKEEVQKFLDWASKGYIDRYREMLHFRGEVASPLVVGPSKFPSQEKKLESLRKREEELEKFKEKVLKRAKNLARGRGLSEIEVTKKEIEELKHILEVMKEANKIVRNKKLSKEEKEKKLQEIGAFEIKGYPFYWPEPDYMGRLGFPSFDLDSVRRKIKQREERLKRLEEKEEHKGEVNVVKETKDYKIVEDYTKDRVLIYFTGIPSEEVRNALKKKGFRWSPHWKAWSRKLTKVAVMDAEEILAKFYKDKKEAKKMSGKEKLRTKKSYSSRGLWRHFYKDSRRVGFYEIYRNEEGELVVSMYGFYIPEHGVDCFEMDESEIRKYGWDNVCKGLKDYLKEYTDYVCEYLKKDFNEMSEAEKQTGEAKEMTEEIWKYFKRETGIPIYDEMLKNKEYYEREKGICFDIMYMKPKEFLERAADIAGKSVEEMRRMIDTNVVKKYKDLMEKGERFPMLVLDYIRGIHEGRHRALAGELMTLEKVPVLIVYDCEKGCPLEKGEKKMTEEIWRVGRDLKPVRVKEPNFENLKEGVILIDKSGAKWKIIKVEKGSIPAENKYTLQSLENKDWTLNYKLPGIERYYKIYVGEVQEKPKEEKIPKEVLEYAKEYLKAEKEIEEKYHIPFTKSALFEVSFAPKGKELIDKYGEETLRRAFDLVKSKMLREKESSVEITPKKITDIAFYMNYLRRIREKYPEWEVYSVDFLKDTLDMSRVIKSPAHPKGKTEYKSVKMLSKERELAEDLSKAIFVYERAKNKKILLNTLKSYKSMFVDGFIDKVSAYLSTENQSEKEVKKMTPTRKLLERYEEKLRRGELDDVGKLFLWYLRKKAGVIK